ncbi:Retrovirus-related Pol polyprotein from transposon [Trichinella papuae]|uniref:Retrovirus-related Pol polyprotein from transposon n=1 Tax=Trichinella papuae TaxID=268474 RepID=A0A0V1N0Z2_9BILA|nr:Retrovirus-related Pol polyprotein from transposon [Trichinella papuae]
MEHHQAITLSANDLGQTRVMRHFINTGSAKPIKLPPRRLMQHQRKEERCLLEDMLHRTVVELSSSAWGAPIALVRKKDDSTRFYVEFHRINVVTTKDAQPLPRIDDTLGDLSGAKWFSTLGFASETGSRNSTD